MQKAFIDLWGLRVPSWKPYFVLKVDAFCVSLVCHVEGWVVCWNLKWRITGFDVCLPFSFSTVYLFFFFLITMLGDAVCHFPHSLSYFSSTCNVTLYEWWHKQRYIRSVITGIGSDPLLEQAVFVRMRPFTLWLSGHTGPAMSAMLQY